MKNLNSFYVVVRYAEVLLNYVEATFDPARDYLWPFPTDELALNQILIRIPDGNNPDKAVYFKRPCFIIINP